MSQQLDPPLDPAGGRGVTYPQCTGHSVPMPLERGTIRNRTVLLKVVQTTEWEARGVGECADVEESLGGVLSPWLVPNPVPCGLDICKLQNPFL